MLPAPGVPCGFLFGTNNGIALFWNPPRVSHGNFLTLAVRPHAMLFPMQQPTATPPSPASPGFAGVLAALAAPALKPGSSGKAPLPPGRKPAPAWNDDGLGDDIATLSYERALRANARYRPPAGDDPPLAQPANPLPSRPEPGPSRFDERAQSASATPPQAAVSAAANLDFRAKPELAADPEPEPARLPAAPLDRNLKDASITIRLSKAECAQLHRRAAEAGLTVSAYLRSCTFEAESLREMVKDTLAQLRSATTTPAAAAGPALRRPGLFRRFSGWMARLFNPWQGGQRVARV